MIAVAGVAVWLLLPTSLGEIARRQMLSRLREHYPHLHITIGRGVVDPRRGVMFEDVRFAEPASGMAGHLGLHSRPIVEVERIVAQCRIQPHNVRRQAEWFRSERIVVEGLTGHLWRKDDGSLAAMSLWPLPEMNSVTPKVDLRRCRLRVEGDGDPIDIDATRVSIQSRLANRERGMTPPSRVTRLPRANDSPVHSHTAADRTTDPDRVVHREMVLEGSADFADRWSAKIRTVGESIDAVADIENIRINETLFARLPTELRDALSELRGLQCTANMQLAYGNDATLSVADETVPEPKASSKRLLVERLWKAPDTSPSPYRVAVQLNRGRFEHDELPYPLENLRADVVVDRDRLRIKNAAASFARAALRCNGLVVDYATRPEVDLRVTAQSLRLDQAMADTFAPMLREHWEKMRPLGTFDADLRFGYSSTAKPKPSSPSESSAIDGDHGSAASTMRPPTSLQDWSVEGTVRCRNIDLIPQKFPYPITGIAGSIDVRHHRLIGNELVGTIGGNRFRCDFDVPMMPDRDPLSVTKIEVDGPLAIDEVLLDALTPRGESTSKLDAFVRGLDPRGSIHLRSASLSRDAAGEPHREFDLEIIDGHLRYDLFPYPIHNVDGRILVRDGVVTLDGFRGTDAGGGVVRCGGSYRLPTRPVTSPAANSAFASVPSIEQPNAVATEDPGVLAMQFEVDRLSMDRRLRDSLPTNVRAVWDAVRPSGILDQANVRLDRVGSEPVRLHVSARQLDREIRPTDGLSIQPDSLPYRIDIVGGTAVYDGTEVRIEDLRGMHDRSRIAAAAVGRTNEEGRWVLAVDLLGGSRIYPDSEFLSSLPSSVRAAARSLQLRGPLNVRGQSQWLLPDDSDAEPVVQWDLVVGLEGNRIGDVGPVHSLRGEVSVRGKRDAVNLSAVGNVAIDSMHVWNQQITAVRGPFRIDDDWLRIGDGVPQRVSDAAAADPSQVIRVVRGKLFGGELNLDGNVELSSGKFDVELAIGGAQVPEVLADFGHGDQELTGTLSGRTNLQGSLLTIDLLRGTGTARVTGANLYELPLIVQMFNSLRITPSKKTAFTDAQVDFTLFADHVTMSDLQLWGDLVSLQGGGTMDGRRHLNLTFNTRVSPQNALSRLARPLGQSRYTIWTVDVHGPIDDVQIERRALEGMRTFGQWFPGNRSNPDSVADNEDSRTRFWKFSR